MSDSAPSSSSDTPDDGAQPAGAAAETAWTPESSSPGSATDSTAEHPEFLVGAAFAAGVAAALILRRLAR